MIDRETMEYAAKAAGYKFLGVITDDDGKVIGALVKIGQRKVGWKPVVKDGDALRLMVKCDIHITNNNGAAWANTSELIVIEPHGTDPYAATRRAITRAAAEIGRTMP